MASTKLEKRLLQLQHDPSLSWLRGVPGNLASWLVLGTLPHTKQRESVYERGTNPRIIYVSKKGEIPYGAKARQIAVYLCTRGAQRAAQQNAAGWNDLETRTIRLPPTKTAFARALGVSVGTREIDSVMDMAGKISKVAITIEGGQYEQFENFHIIEKGSLLYGKNQDPQVILSETFFRSIKDSTPIVYLDYMALANRPLDLDLYALAAHAAQLLASSPTEKSIMISWEDLIGQLGVKLSGKNALKNFRARVRRSIESITKVYPAVENCVKVTLDHLVVDDLPPPRAQEGEAQGLFLDSITPPEDSDLEEQIARLQAFSAKTIGYRSPPTGKNREAALRDVKELGLRTAMKMAPYAVRYAEENSLDRPACYFGLSKFYREMIIEAERRKVSVETTIVEAEENARLRRLKERLERENPTEFTRLFEQAQQEIEPRLKDLPSQFHRGMQNAAFLRILRDWELKN